MDYETLILLLMLDLLLNLPRGSSPDVSARSSTSCSSSFLLLTLPHSSRRFLLVVVVLFEIRGVALFASLEVSCELEQPSTRFPFRFVLDPMHIAGLGL